MGEHSRQAHPPSSQVLRDQRILGCDGFEYFTEVLTVNIPKLLEGIHDIRGCLVSK